ncbi:Sugar phosphate isomerase/epimerase [Halogranum amylolyticum]|uniref:Sugar phosphate isomerase/epimerase n=1 Tax=Halogranum amylolyticum TaxID=660520 RepID=A0A1H8U6F5_9EURY|nr:sugar phosphate isomerase/epimerase family protein [Halogranum amylolyticum]SEO98424.1 Sugar phosphate isomerase/epimerase [Halogranum amylolyticum]
MDCRIGFVTQMGMSHETVFEVAADHGFDFVEVMMDGADERTRLAARSDEFRSSLTTHDLDLLVHLPFGGVDLGSPFEHVRAGSVRELAAAVDTAATLGAEKAVVHPTTGAWSPAWDARGLRENVVDSLRTLDEHASEAGVELCAENVPRSVFRTHEFSELLRETDVSMTLDTGHARMDGRDSAGIAAFAERFGDRIGHLHLNDTRQAKDEHLPFGAGDIDFPAVFDALGDDWTGTLSLEVFTHDVDYLGVSKRRLAALL